MRTVAFCILALAAVSASAAPEPGYVPTNFPTFVTASMRERHGLKDEQYKALWAIGAHPTVEPAAMKDLMFHAARGQNLEEWIGDTTGQPELGAKISETLETNKWLVARNAYLEAANARLEAYAGELYVANTNLTAKYEEAKPNAAITVRIQDALRAEGTLGPYLRNELVQMRDRTEDPKKKEVFESCIALMDSVVNGVRDTDMK